jgi:hypothetical protein
MYKNNGFLTRLAIGTFLKEWTADIVDCKEKKPFSRLAIYSGHDTTLAPVLVAMQAPVDEYPGYASNVNIILI